MAGIASGNLVSSEVLACRCCSHYERRGKQCECMQLSKWEAYTDKNNTAVNLIQGKRLDGPDLEETFCSYDLNHAVLLVG